MQFNVRSGCALVVLLSLVHGCGGSGDGLDRHVVAGKVTLDGNPVANGLIQFTSAPGAKHSLVSGASIKDGSYKLPPIGGLTPGTYSVTISSSPPPPPSPSDPAEAMKAAAEMQPAKELIPAKYNTKTELTVEVKATGETEANFDLKSGT